jgi:hypothetical protein
MKDMIVSVTRIGKSNPTRLSFEEFLQERLREGAVMIAIGEPRGGAASPDADPHLQVQHEE